MNKSIVFIHGLGLGEWIFEEHFIPYYRSLGFDVHSFNLPGHFQYSTESDRQNISLANCVDFVREYLNSHLHQPYVIVGMSMGSAICQKLLESDFYPKNLNGVVLMSPVPPTSNLLFTLRLCRSLAKTKPQVLIDFFTETTNSQLVFSESSLNEYTSEKINGYLEQTLNGFSLLEYELFFQDLVKSHFVSKVPIKIIGGEDDLLFSPDVANFTASYYSQRAEILPGLGHMIPVESNYIKGINAVDSFLEVVF